MLSLRERYEECKDIFVEEKLRTKSECKKGILYMVSNG